MLENRINGIRRSILKRWIVPTWALTSIIAGVNVYKTKDKPLYLPLMWEVVSIVAAANTYSSYKRTKNID